MPLDIYILKQAIGWDSHVALTQLDVKHRRLIASMLDI